MAPARSTHTASRRPVKASIEVSRPELVLVVDKRPIWFRFNGSPAARAITNRTGDADERGRAVAKAGPHDQRDRADDGGEQQSHDSENDREQHTDETNGDDRQEREPLPRARP